MPFRALMRPFSRGHPRRRRNLILLALTLLALLLIIILPLAIILPRKGGGKDRGHDSNKPIVVSSSPAGQQAGPEIAPSFLSYSVEFSSFPGFAGTSQKPNTFTRNLLANIETLQGSKSIIRVGGNTQDFALLDPKLRKATGAEFISSKGDDSPTILDIGPSFFNAYRAFPKGTQFIHGFNMALNSTSDRQQMLDTVSMACKALSDGRLFYWELGNEPDLYKRDVQDRPVARPASWGDQDYVHEWQSVTKSIQDQLRDACPDMAKKSQFKLVAPSFSAPRGPLNLVNTWKAGLNEEEAINEISVHNYIDSVTSPGATLQSTLLNHEVTVSSVAPHVEAMKHLNSPASYTLGETNSVYGYGAPFFANTFGAALWNVDYALWCASVGIHRIHMHQGLNFPYGSWQAVNSGKENKTTKPAYYGNIATAAMLGNLDKNSVRIANLKLDRNTEAAYAAYVNDHLKRLLVVNMVEFNTSSRRTASSRGGRSKELYSFQLPSSSCGSKNAIVRRLIAAGTDVLSGVTFDGYSFNSELNDGKPVRLSNSTVGERIQIRSDGQFSVELPHSSAAMIELDC